MNNKLLRLSGALYALSSALLFLFASICFSLAISISVPVFSLYHQFWPEKNERLSQQLAESLPNVFKLAKFASGFSLTPEAIKSVSRIQSEITAVSFSLPQLIGLDEEKNYLVCAALAPSYTQMDYQGYFSVFKGIVRPDFALMANPNIEKNTCRNSWMEFKGAPGDSVDFVDMEYSENLLDGVIFLDEPIFRKFCTFRSSIKMACTKKDFLLKNGTDIILASTKREALSLAFLNLVSQEIEEGRVSFGSVKERAID